MFFTETQELQITGIFFSFLKKAVKNTSSALTFYPNQEHIQQSNLAKQKDLTVITQLLSIQVKRLHFHKVQDSSKTSLLLTTVLTIKKPV